VHLGHPAQVLLERAEALGADLIVLGSHRERGLLDLGGTARAVLGRFSGRIWLQCVPVRPIRRVRIGLDLSADSLRALDVAHAVAERLGAELELLHVYEPADFGQPPYGEGAVLSPTYVLESERDRAKAELDQIASGRDWRGVPVKTRFEEGSALTRLLEHEEDTDLLVVGTHGHTGLLRTLLGGTALGVLRGAHGPVLAVPRPERDWLLCEDDGATVSGSRRGWAVEPEA
jgi:nucleotide-binding universal stress UspA family protein